MRSPSILTIAILAAGALAPVSADAVTRHRYRYHAPAYPPLVVPVEPRSFLDPGPIPPVGTYSRYVYVSQYPHGLPYSYRCCYGEPPLPGFWDGGRPQFEGLDFGPLSGSR
jgi:hypothetical protein